jgi:hypothetical protein
MIKKFVQIEEDDVTKNWLQGIKIDDICFFSHLFLSVGTG